MPIKKTLETLVRNDKSLGISLGTFTGILPTNEEALENLHNCQECTTESEHSHKTTYTIYQQQNGTMCAKVSLRPQTVSPNFLLGCAQVTAQKILGTVQNYGCIYLVKIHTYYNCP